MGAWRAANSQSWFLELSGTFFPQGIFNTWKIEPADVKPTDTEA